MMLFQSEIPDNFPEMAVAVLPKMIDERKLKVWLFSLLRPEGAVCPHCQSKLTATAEKKYREFDRAWCVSCHKLFKAVEGTPFAATKIPLEKLFAISVLLAAGVGHKDLQRLAGIKKQAATVWREKLQGYHPTAENTGHDSE